MTDEARKALADEIENAIHITIRQRNEVGRVVSTNLMPQHRELIVAALRTQDERQRVVIKWGESAFGVDHMRDKIVRAARFFEEAAEVVQAVGLPRNHAQRAFDHVYSRAPGDPAQEAGGAANTLMALCGAIGLSLDECQRAEIERCLAKDPAHFAARNEAKLREVDAAPEAGTQEPVACQARDKIHGGAWHDAPMERFNCNPNFEYRRLYAAPASHEAMLALEPFAAIAEYVTESQRDSRPIIFGMDNVILQRLTIGDLRKAKSALAALTPSHEAGTQAFKQCEQCWQPATCKKYGCREAAPAEEVSAETTEQIVARIKEACAQVADRAATAPREVTPGTMARNIAASIRALIPSPEAGTQERIQSSTEQSEAPIGHAISGEGA